MPKKGLERLAELLASAWHHGNWKAETPNEREMQTIMEKHGFWPYSSSCKSSELPYSSPLAKRTSMVEVAGGDERPQLVIRFLNMDDLHAASDYIRRNDCEWCITLNGHQLLNALQFIAPDRTTDQLESDATIQWGSGHSGEGHYICMTEYPEEGWILLKDEPEKEGK